MTKGADPSDEAYVTLATDDSSAQGALVLGHSLRATDTPHALVVLATEAISSEWKEQLGTVFDLVEVVSPESEEVCSLMEQKPELRQTLAKLHCWKLTQFSKVVFLDNDTLVVKACDELFDWEELSASPDSGWPDMFNTGVLVLQPSLPTFQALISAVLANPQKISADGGDQGLLNLYFQAKWSTSLKCRLPFIYNMAAVDVYTYLPAYLRKKDEVKVIHFGGHTKPWMLPPTGSILDRSPAPTGMAPVYTEHVGLWWDIYHDKVATPDSKEGPAAQLPAKSQAPVSSEQARKQAWECGQMDYLGEDCFDNIQRRLDDIINKTPQQD